MLGGLAGLLILIGISFIGSKVAWGDPHAKVWLVIGGILLIGVALGAAGVQPGSYEP